MTTQHILDSNLHQIQTNLFPGLPSPTPERSTLRSFFSELNPQALEFLHQCIADAFENGITGEIKRFDDAGSWLAGGYAGILKLSFASKEIEAAITKQAFIDWLVKWMTKKLWAYIQSCLISRLRDELG